MWGGCSWLDNVEGVDTPLGFRAGLWPQHDLAALSWRGYSRRRLTGQAQSRREPERRYPILLTLLAQSAVDVLDETLLLFDQALSARESAAKAKLTEVLADRARGGEHRQVPLDEILRVVLDPAIGDEQIGALLRNGVGMDRMRSA